MAKTLYVAVTFHGFGHVAQTAPIVNTLMERNPTLRVVIESAAPRELLAVHFREPFDHVNANTDFGMVMHDSLDVDAEASHQRYLAQIGRWEEEVDSSARRLSDNRASLLLANVPYLPLIAAKRLGIPAFGYCSLNWLETYGAYCSRFRGSDEVQVLLQTAYRSATMFLVPEPGMPMPELAHVRNIGPVARIGKACRAQLQSILDVGDGTRIAVLFMGGVHTPVDFSRFPKREDLFWVIGGTR